MKSLSPDYGWNSVLVDNYIYIYIYVCVCVCAHARACVYVCVLYHTKHFGLVWFLSLMVYQAFGAILCQSLPWSKNSCTLYPRYRKYGIAYISNIIIPKVNVRSRLEFELAYYDVVVKHIRHTHTHTHTYMCVCACLYVYIYTHTHNVTHKKVHPNFYIKDQFSSKTHTHIHTHIRLVGRVFANGPQALGSIPGIVIPKTLKMVLDTA